MPFSIVGYRQSTQKFCRTVVADTFDESVLLVMHEKKTALHAQNLANN
jgi:hypothetical protein